MIFYWQSRDGAVASVDYSSAAAIAPHYPRKNSNSPPPPPAVISLDEKGIFC